MTEAKQGDIVRVNYSGRLLDGTEFESTRDQDPLEFTIGAQKVIPAFEKLVVGMQPGESKYSLIQSDDAYGAYHSSRVIEVERNKIPSDLAIEIGKVIEIRRSDETAIPAMITDFSDNLVTLDANHPLAGKDLIFEVELIDIL